jgi:sec-independent protein translocase protein TatA
MGAIEPWHLVVVLVVVLLIFGPKRLPEVGKSLGETIREFRKATTGEHKDSVSEATAPPAPAASAPPASVAPAASAAAPAAAPAAMAAIVPAPGPADATRAGAPGPGDGSRG